MHTLRNVSRTALLHWQIMAVAYLADVVPLGLLEVCQEVVKAAVVIVGPVVLDACAPQKAQVLQSISLLWQVEGQVGAGYLVLICPCSAQVRQPADLMVILTELG